jgi:hypothetical protein
MSHRLPCAPLTREDRKIWDAICYRCWAGKGDWRAAHHRAQTSDTVDAALMWSMAGIASDYPVHARHEVLAFHFASPLLGPFP